MESQTTTATRIKKKRGRRLTGALLIAAGVLACLLIVLFVAFKIYLGSGMASKRIAGMLEASMGGQFEIGSIRHHWPLRFTMKDIKGSPDEEGTAPFASIGEINVNVGLTYLTTGIVPSLIVRNIDLTLEQNADGSWKHLPTKAKDEFGREFAFPVEHLQVEDGDVHLVVGGRKVNVAPINLTILAQDGGSKLDLTADASIPETGSRLSLNGHADLSSATPEVKLNANLKSFPLIVLDPLLQMLPQEGLAITEGVGDTAFTVTTARDAYSINVTGSIRNLAGRHKAGNIGPVSARVDLNTKVDHAIKNASIEKFEFDLAGIGIIKASGTVPLKPVIPVALSVLVKDVDIAALGKALGANLGSGRFNMNIVQSRNTRGGGPVSGFVKLERFSGEMAGYAIHDASLDGRLLGLVADEAKGASATFHMDARIGSATQNNRLYNLSRMPLKLDTEVGYSVDSDLFNVGSSRIQAGSSTVLLVKGTVLHIASIDPILDLETRTTDISLPALAGELAGVREDWSKQLEGVKRGKMRAILNVSGIPRNASMTGTVTAADLTAESSLARIESASAEIPFEIRNRLLQSSASVEAATLLLRNASGATVATLLDAHAHSDVIQTENAVRFNNTTLRMGEAHGVESGVSLADTLAQGNLIWSVTPSSVHLQDMEVAFGESGSLNVNAEILPSVSMLKSLSARGKGIPARFVWQMMLPFLPKAPPADSVEGEFELDVTASDLSRAGGAVNARFTADNFNLDTGDVLVQLKGLANLRLETGRNARVLQGGIHLEDGGFLFHDSSLFLEKHPLDVLLKAQFPLSQTWPMTAEFSVDSTNILNVTSKVRVESATPGGAPSSYQVDLNVNNLARSATPSTAIADALQHFVPTLTGSRIGFDRIGLSARVTGEGRVVAGAMALRDFSYLSSVSRVHIRGVSCEIPINLDLSAEPSARGAPAPATGTIAISSIMIGGVEVRDIRSFRVQIERNQMKLLEPLIIPLFGGRLRISQLDARRDTGNGAVMTCGLEADDLDVAEMTSGMELGPFPGSMNARFPEISVNSESINMAGEIKANIFDGTAVVRDLSFSRYLDPILREVCFSLDADNLDLQQTTTSIGFGTITGIFQIQIPTACICIGCGWIPTALQADIHTVKKSGVRQTIDLRALNNLTKIASGGSLGANVFIGFFERFAYDGIGLSAMVGNDLYQVRGRYQYEDYDLILKGSGIPRVNIILPSRERVRDFRTTYESLQKRFSEITMGAS